MNETVSERERGERGRERGAGLLERKSLRRLITFGKGRQVGGSLYIVFERKVIKKLMIFC